MKFISTLHYKVLWDALYHRAPTSNIETKNKSHMQTSQDWIDHFQQNAGKKRIDFSMAPAISETELRPILSSLQAWQLGETSDGFHLLKAATSYASKIGDPDYTEAVRLFIREEQKHGNHLGLYLDAIGARRIKYNWGDELFRRIRYFNTSMEIWTVAVITVESTAQVFYQAIKDASRCQLLKQICTDILIDEADHIRFQGERLAILFQNKRLFSQWLASKIYPVFFMTTSVVVWLAHKEAFRAGGLNFFKYWRKMQFKRIKCLPGRISLWSSWKYRLQMKSQTG